MVDVIDQFCVCDIFPAAAGLASLLLSRGGGSLREETANGPASADSRVMAKQAHSTEKLHYMQFMVLHMKRHFEEKSNK